MNPMEENPYCGPQNCVHFPKAPLNYEEVALFCTAK
jgi:hypothetical protein